MTDLPTGTVTFLFTDIEGSTGLLQALGDRYAAVLDEHAAIVRRAVADGGGVEVSTHGDAFSRCSAARPGPSGRRSPPSRASPPTTGPGNPVRVRMGVHTGEGTLGGDDYAGIDVHRTARIADAAHGGQVIVSDATGASSSTPSARAPPSATWGAPPAGHRHPERLHQLVTEGLPADFPGTPDAGRQAEQPAAAAHLVRGPGGRDRRGGAAPRPDPPAHPDRARGSGKSRLALRVAAELLTRFRDGSCFVDLSPVTDPALVPAAVANAWGSRGGRAPDPRRRQGASPPPRAPPGRRQLRAGGRGRPVIEERLGRAEAADDGHLPGRAVAPRRAGVPGPAARARPLGRSPTGLAAIGAVEVSAVRRAGPGRQPPVRPDRGNAPVVAEITARLDGLLLAIELAATRTKVLTPEQILSRLKRRLSILTSGRGSLPERQRTLRRDRLELRPALEPGRARLFARLSVFAGGWTFESAEAVCDRRSWPGRPRRADLAGGQVADPQTELPAAVAVLDAGDDPGVRAGAARGGRRPRAGPAAPRRALPPPGRRGRAPPHRRRPGHLARPLRAGARQHPRRPPLGHRPWRGRTRPGGRRRPVAVLAAARHLAEGRRWLEETLASAVGAGAGRGAGKALAGAGDLVERPGGARAFYDEALAIERELGDPARLAEALYNEAFAPPPSTTWRRPPACSTRASSCSARSGTSPERPECW